MPNVYAPVDVYLPTICVPWDICLPTLYVPVEIYMPTLYVPADVCLSLLWKSEPRWRCLLSSSIGTTAHCGLWHVEQYHSIFSYLPPTLSIFSLPAFEDLFLLLLSNFSWVFPFFSSLPVLEWSDVYYIMTIIPLQYIDNYKLQDLILLVFDAATLSDRIPTFRVNLASTSKTVDRS